LSDTTPNPPTPSASDEPRQQSPDGDAPAPHKKRRRGSRGGRNRNRSARAARTTTTTAAGDAQPDDLPERISDGRPSPEAAERALVRKPQIGDTRPAAPPGPPVRPDDDDGDTGNGDGPSRKRRRRGGRGRSRSGERPIEQVVGDAVELDEETLEKRRGRERKGRAVGRYLMCVSVKPQATQIAVLEGRALIEHYVSKPQDDVSQIHGNIYLGRVQNVLPGMEAAFVDIGTPKNAVLYRGDVQYDPEDVEGGGQNARIEQLLRARQSIICQVTKNPIGTKGARLTQEVSLPGRFVVLIPGSTTYGISKRLADDERKRLRSILDRIKPAQHGLIVRTAAEGATRDELERDVARLLQQWDQIDALAKRSTAPTLLYREPDMAVRIIREEFNANYRGIVIDDPQLHGEVRDYVASITPELADRVELHDPAVESLPLFEQHHVHEQLHKALDRKVWLPSGGSLIIERTEALTVIDVNTGKNVGSSSLEETVFKNNLEAAEEVARQLRLRDIGGIIVIDFIDMEIRRNRDEVVRVFRDALARDKTRTQVFEISELGLVEMTRKRIGEGLLESMSSTCPECEGRGIVLDRSLLD
jgi:ribonuclease E